MPCFVYVKKIAKNVPNLGEYIKLSGNEIERKHTYFLKSRHSYFIFAFIANPCPFILNFFQLFVNGSTFKCPSFLLEYQTF